MKNKIILFLAVISMVFYTPIVFAQNNNKEIEDLTATIEILQKHIQILQQRLDALNASQSEEATEEDSGEEATEEASTTATAKETKKAAKMFAKTLKLGMRGADVEDLQEYLAQFPDIYPEGYTTGYFGKLTEKAVKKFQKKYGIEQVGIFGPKTRSRINELLTEGAGKSGHVPKGLTTAPGIQKKLGNGDNDDNEEPTVGAPEISGLTASSITDTSATISWTTDQFAKGEVYLSTTTPVSTTEATTTDSHYLRDHSFVLSTLTPDTTYYYVVVSTNALGNATTSNEGTFSTVEEPDTTAPTFSNHEESNITNTSVTISWTTDEEADSAIYLSTTSPVPTTEATTTDATFVTNHSFDLDGLISDTEYHYVVVSADATGNVATSSELTFNSPSD